MCIDKIIGITILKIYDLFKCEEIKVIKILDKKVRDMWSIYINGTGDEKFTGFKTLEDDLNYVKQKREREEYVKEYTNIYVYFEKIFKTIKGRNIK